MIFNILKKLDDKNPFEQASAQCDISCKIYCLFSAQLVENFAAKHIDHATCLYPSGETLVYPDLKV